VNSTKNKSIFYQTFLVLEPFKNKILNVEKTLFQQHLHFKKSYQEVQLQTPLQNKVIGMKTPELQMQETKTKLTFCSTTVTEP